jgi:hypothetical protein
MILRMISQYNRSGFSRQYLFGRQFRSRTSAGGPYLGDGNALLMFLPVKRQACGASSSVSVPMSSVLLSKRSMDSACCISGGFISESAFCCQGTRANINNTIQVISFINQLH